MSFVGDPHLYKLGAQLRGEVQGPARLSQALRDEDDLDEFYYCVDGEVIIDLEGDRSVALQPRQGFVVPKGVQHRPRAPKKTILLMVEGAGIVPTGD